MNNVLYVFEINRSVYNSSSKILNLKTQDGRFTLNFY